MKSKLAQMANIVAAEAARKWRVAWGQYGSRAWVDRGTAAGFSLRQNRKTGQARIMDEGGAVVFEGGIRAALHRFGVIAESFSNRRPKECVVIVRGLFLPRVLFAPLVNKLRRAGYAAVMPYLGTRRDSLTARAHNLHYFLAHIRCSKTLRLVGWEAGALIVRRALADEPAWHARLTLKSLVFVSAPMEGFETASALRRRPLMRRMYGAFLAQAAGAEPTPRPPCRYAVIAGGRDDAKGYSRSLAGDNDGVVRVAETGAGAAAAFALVHYWHFVIPMADQTRLLLVRYFRSGRFTALIPLSRRRR
ncbi:hypothetical protein FACS1894186_2440 [Alphaproteobacteria bacterium]|nr:hypothetical protein FACS1894186_2440 [Alphaproteobacteria bacterium]